MTCWWMGLIVAVISLTVACNLASSLASKRFSISFRDFTTVSWMFSALPLSLPDWLFFAFASRLGTWRVQVLHAQNMSVRSATCRSDFFMSAQFRQNHSRQKLHSVGVPLDLRVSQVFLHEAHFESSVLGKQDSPRLLLSFRVSPFWICSPFWLWSLCPPSWMASFVTESVDFSPLRCRDIAPAMLLSAFMLITLTPP